MGEVMRLDPAPEVLRVRDYTTTPGGRYASDGKFPGEEFLSSFLVPAYEAAQKRGAQLLVDLDGTSGYASSFLEEAFGGLARKFGRAAVKRVLVIKSLEEPYLVQDVQSYVEAVA